MKIAQSGPRFSFARLSSRDQQRIFQATTTTMNGRWKNRNESVLMTFAEDLAIWQKALTPSGMLIAHDDMRHIMRSTEFKQEYRKTKRAYLHLKQRKLIITENRNNEITTNLSNKGLQRALLISIRSAQQLPEGLSYLVIFDFPESARESRDHFRRALKNADMNQLQLSAWITKKDVGEELAELVRTLKITDWVKVFLAKSIEGTLSAKTYDRTFLQTKNTKKK